MIINFLKHITFYTVIKRIIVSEKRYRLNKSFQGKAVIAALYGADIDTYRSLKSYREAEHQIGRFINMKKVITEIENLSIDGDIVEFGTWEGVGLHLLDMAFQKKTDRMLVGIDSFEGLPKSTSIWKKGAFSETSIDSVDKYLDTSIVNCSKGFLLIKGWYSDPEVKTSLYNKVNKVAAFHLDADLGSSSKEALHIIEGYLDNRTDPLFILFDDWGCHPDEVPDAFYEWQEFAQKKYNFKVEKFSSTNLTRYFKLSFE